MTTRDLTLHSLSTAKFRTSKFADDLNSRFLDLLGFAGRNEVARLAIARSLSISEPPGPVPAELHEEDGRTIEGVNLFGEDLPVWIALVIEHAGHGELSLREIQEQIKQHWHRGITSLQKDWDGCGKSYDRFVLGLAERGGVSAVAHEKPDSGDGLQRIPGAVRLRLGQIGVDVRTRVPVSWVVNKDGAPHIAIMGKSGTGKTRTGMHMLCQAHEQSGCPVLVLDFARGDLANNAELVRKLGATVVPVARKPIPLDVLHLREQIDLEAKAAAFRFRDSFSAVSKSRPGGKQLDGLREAAYRTFLSGKPPFRLQDVYDNLKALYAEQKKGGADVVLSTFNDLTSFELFKPELSPEDFFRRSWIIDLHDLPAETVRRTVVFLLLDALYAWCRHIEDSSLDEQGYRSLRLCVAIDEANRLLGYGQPSLSALVRECRGKGLSLFFMSQSPDDFDREEDNFLENIGLALTFDSSAHRARALKAFLGQPVELSGLAAGVAVTRIPGRSGIVHVQAWE